MLLSFISCVLWYVLLYPSHRPNPLMILSQTYCRVTRTVAARKAAEQAEQTDQQDLQESAMEKCEAGPVGDDR